MCNISRPKIEYTIEAICFSAVQGKRMPDDALIDKQHQLNRFIAEQADEILPTLRFFVLRAGLAQGGQAVQMALELLDELTVTALQSAARFQAERGARAWLLGIAANLIRRKQAALARLERREPLAADLALDGAGILDEDAFFDRLAGQDDDDPERRLLEDEALQRRLERLSPADRHVLRLAVIAGFNGDELAATLGVSPGAARVRLHRALIRLRQAWSVNDEN
jgi:RNA polymerase sigma factor (sigma-70 family)